VSLASVVERSAQQTVNVTLGFAWHFLNVASLGIPTIALSLWDAARPASSVPAVVVNSLKWTPVLGNAIRIGEDLRKISDRGMQMSDGEKLKTGLDIAVNAAGLALGVRGMAAGGASSAGRPLTRAQARTIQALRDGEDVYVRDVAEARKLLEHLPELRPFTSSRYLPGAPSPRGTYRGDLINTRNPTAQTVHPPGSALPAHVENPHYNLYFHSGTKSAILIMTE